MSEIITAENNGYAADLWNQKRVGEFSGSGFGNEKTDLNGQYLIRCDQDWFEEAEQQVNGYLDENKQKIVKDIFGTQIPIGEIKVTLENFETVYFVNSVSVFPYRDADGQMTELGIETLQYENGENTRSFESRISDWNHSDDMEKTVSKIVWDIVLSDKTSLNSGQLFLPASRSGLQLLYRHYFAGKANGNLVMPVKDFLRFLQLYSEDMQLDERRKALLEFGEEYLLQGTVSQKGEETFYIDRNAGLHVIISSHSDTMASRLNNLLMLTWRKQRRTDYEMLFELGLKDVDLLHPDKKAGIYEFRNDEQGKTTVERLEFTDCPLIGYDFQLFGRNLDKLFDEADRITR